MQRITILIEHLDFMNNSFEFVLCLIDGMDSLIFKYFTVRTILYHLK